MIEIIWHARGGQGGFTASRLLGLAASVFSNYYSQAFSSFGPERRGAYVSSFTRINDKPITDHSQVYECDYAIVFDSTLTREIDVSKSLKKNGILLINSTLTKINSLSYNNKKIITFDATGLAIKESKTPITNTIMLGVLAAISDIVSLEELLKAIEVGMPLSLRAINKKLVETAYILQKESYK